MANHSYYNPAEEPGQHQPSYRPYNQTGEPGQDESSYRQYNQATDTGRDESLYHYPNQSQNQYIDNSANPGSPFNDKNRRSPSPEIDQYGYGSAPPQRDIHTGAHPSSYSQQGEAEAGFGGPAANYYGYSTNPSQQAIINHNPNDQFPETATAAEGAYAPKRRRKRRTPAEPKPWYRQHSYAVWFLTTIQVAVFIGELINNGILTGSPIAIKPQFNPTIGPSPYVLINMGARFVPCMRNTKEILNSTLPVTFPCPNSTTTVGECSLSELCGMTGVPNPIPGGSIDTRPQPNQWYRFIIPMFLHAGILHIGFNMLLQLTLGREIEGKIGPIRFMLIYLTAGIFGFVLGGAVSGPGISSTGASGSLFGIIAINLLDLLYNWGTRKKPWRELLIIIIDIVISFVLGLLPGIDNFSHIGGFIMGLAIGICILHTPPPLRKRIGLDPIPYQPIHKNEGFTALGPMSTITPGLSLSTGAGVSSNPTPSASVPTSRSKPSSSRPPVSTVAFLKNPVAFFKNRKAGWWVWSFLRVGALVAVLVGFILLLTDFYANKTQCSWCKHLSCLPVKNWCDVGNLQFESPTTSAAVTTPVATATPTSTAV